MAKTAQRRQHANRLKNKWQKLLQSIDPDRSLECITFGKIFSKDPLDCGVPNCPLCSHGKVFFHKSNRIQSRKVEREELHDFLEENEITSVEPNSPDHTE